MPHVTRRSFLKGASVALSTTPLLAAKGDDDKSSVASLPGSTPTTIRLTTNGKEKQVVVAPTTTLSMLLRESLGMTGTKVSCERGACGACTVLLNGAPVAACLTLALDADGQDVRTIEGVASSSPPPSGGPGGDGAAGQQPGGERASEQHLHPVQQAFVDADALQCGFCTPGMIMSAVHFYDQWKTTNAGRPTQKHVARAMAGNLCRCGSQPAIVEAIRSACAGTTAKPLGEKSPVYALKRVDAREKVTGSAKYAFDHYPKDGLHAVFVRAQHGHERIIDVDTSAAEAMPGVKAVSVVATKMGGGYLTMRWVGQEIAVVAATSEDQARAAAAKVFVKVEKLPVVTTQSAAAQKDAPAIWPNPSDDDIPTAAEGPSSSGFFMPWKKNVRGPSSWPFSDDNADAIALVKKSEVKTDLHLTTEVQVHATLERHVVVVTPDDDGGLTVYATTQTVQILASELAEALQLAPTAVRVLSPYVGGAFGCKAGLRPEHLAAAKLALQTKKSVRLALSFAEHMTVGGNRPGTEQTIQIGATSKGDIDAVVHHGRSNCGAAIGEKSTGMTASHYAFKQVEIVDDNIVTNGAPACPWRAPGFPPNAFALEQAIDDVAVMTNKDPLLLRLENEKRKRFRGVYRLARERSGMASRLKNIADPGAKDRGRFVTGVGTATAHWFVLTSPSCQVRLRARRDGTLQAAVATHDMGQGSKTVIANVLTETLGVDVTAVSVSIGDSNLPPAPGSFGSITTSSIAPATFHAAKALQKELARGGLDAGRGERQTERGILTKRGKLIAWRELFEDLPDDLVEVSARRGPDASGFSFPPRPFDVFSDHMGFAIAKDVVSSAQVAEVEVDRLLGTISVKRVVVAIDAGRIAAPVTARSQVVGAVMQGVSFALYEARRLDPNSGRNLTSSFDNYAILGFNDAPDVDVHFLPSPSENNPYGSLGLGENAIIATGAAVANALYRATGRRILSTPMRPHRILAALEG